jgi:hypothetical protein
MSADTLLREASRQWTRDTIMRAQVTANRNVRALMAEIVDWEPPLGRIMRTGRLTAWRLK